jgi:hypothetical protein
MSARKPKRIWTYAEVKQFELLINKGLSGEEIAQLMGRTMSSIKQKAFWLNLSFAQNRRDIDPPDGLTISAV